jgi:ectoine hydroxylase-related dioxygenase (phytanoyl-CoA dioxygenase family)
MITSPCRNHNRHCDTPYNNAKFRDWQRDSGSDDFPDVHKPLGVQCNLCVDEYTAENGGTMFVPNSWALGRQPPVHFNDGMPSAPRDARQMLAPAGTLLMYHAATYHRLHVNVSDQPRIGVLQSFVPDFIRELAGARAHTHSKAGQNSARRALATWLHETDPGRRESYAEFAASEAFQAMRPREHVDLRQVWTGGSGEPSRL